MASPSPSVTTAECDGYIPMSPRTFSFLNTNCNVESSTTLSPRMCQPGDFAPPPIHRHLKPRLRRGENQHSTDWFMLDFWHCVEKWAFVSAQPIHSVAGGLNDVLDRMQIHRHTVKVICISVQMIRSYKCQYKIHVDISYTDLWYTMIFTMHHSLKAGLFHCTLENYIQSNNFVLSWFTARPPPLDLRGLSTITECPTHLPLSRAMTESWWEKKKSSLFIHKVFPLSTAQYLNMMTK